MLIGLSISTCCQDIAQGKVKLKDVKSIIARTAIDAPEVLEKVIQDYKMWYWVDETSAESERLMRYFFAEGKVEQPRLTHKRIPDINISRGGHWVKSRRQIKWTVDPRD